MKREEVTAIFPDATDEQITNYLNQIGSETKGYKQKLASAGDKDTRIAELEKELEKINKQNMSDIELANAERDKALSSVANLEKQMLGYGNSIGSHSPVEDMTGGTV